MTKPKARTRSWDLTRYDKCSLGTILRAPSIDADETPDMIFATPSDEKDAKTGIQGAKAIVHRESRKAREAP